jgi:hypothetical protein
MRIRNAMAASVLIAGFLLTACAGPQKMARTNGALDCKSPMTTHKTVSSSPDGSASVWLDSGDFLVAPPHSFMPSTPVTFSQQFDSDGDLQYKIQGTTDQTASQTMQIVATLEGCQTKNKDEFKIKLNGKGKGAGGAVHNGHGRGGLGMAVVIDVETNKLHFTADSGWIIIGD